MIILEVLDECSPLLEVVLGSPESFGGIPKREAKGLLTYAFANNVLESVKIPALKLRINKLIADKLGVSIGHDL